MSDDLKILEQIDIESRSPNDIGWAMQKAVTKYMQDRDMYEDYARIGVSLKGCTYEGKYEEWVFSFLVWDKNEV